MPQDGKTMNTGITAGGAGAARSDCGRWQQRHLLFYAIVLLTRWFRNSKLMDGTSLKRIEVSAMPLAVSPTTTHICRFMAIATELERYSVVIDRHSECAGEILEHATGVAGRCERCAHFLAVAMQNIAEADISKKEMEASRASAYEKWERTQREEVA